MTERDAQPARLDRTVAIKVLPEHVAHDPNLKRRFEHETRAVAALNHPHGTVKLLADALNLCPICCAQGQTRSRGLGGEATEFSPT